MNTKTLTLYELRTTARNRWLIVAAIAFAVLNAALAFAGSSGGSTGFGPAAAGLINIDLIAVPLFALVVGAMAFARDRERGTYAYIRSLPVTLRDVYISKALSVAVEVSVVVCAGFAGAFAAMAFVGVASGDFSGAAQFALLTWLLALVSAAIGICISAWASRSPAALGAAVASWLVLTVFGDLGVMATSLATRMNVGVLLTLTAINPAEAYKIASVAALSGSVDVLGPGGRLASDTFGSAIMPVMVGIMVLWTIVAVVAGWLFISRRSDA